MAELPLDDEDEDATVFRQAFKVLTMKLVPKDMLHGHETIFSCWLASDAVDCLVSEEVAVSVSDAVAMCQWMLNEGLIEDATGDALINDSTGVELPCFTMEAPNLKCTFSMKSRIDLTLLHLCDLDAAGLLQLTDGNLFRVYILLTSAIVCKRFTCPLTYKEHKDVWPGKDAIQCLMETKLASNAKEAMRVCQSLMDNGMIRCVFRGIVNHEKRSFYRFTDKAVVRKLIDGGATERRRTIREMDEKERGLHLARVLATLKTKLHEKDTRVGRKLHSKCWRNTDAVKVMLKTKLAESMETAAFTGQKLVEGCHVMHVSNPMTPFRADVEDYYRFATGVEPSDIKRDTEMLTKTPEEYMEYMKRISRVLRATVEVKTRTYYMKKYKGLFVAADAVLCLLSASVAHGEMHAVSLGQQLLNARLIAHVADRSDKPFENSKRLFKFTTR